MPATGPQWQSGSSIPAHDLDPDHDLSCDDVSDRNQEQDQDHEQELANRVRPIFAREIKASP
jgi:hypothetical protein